jgi:hypothetical protein
MATHTVLIVRHAEEPTADGRERGVAESGAQCDDELSVRGWQRAGALGHLFASGSSPRHPGIRRPSHLFAAGPSPAHPSRRSVSTLLPLARRLGLPVSRQFTCGEEEALARHVCALDGAILIAWEHQHIPRLAEHLVNDDSRIPERWPADRFDLVWLVVGDDFGRRRFAQVPQMLMAGDAAAGIE